MTNGRGLGTAFARIYLFSIILPDPNMVITLISNMTTDTYKFQTLWTLSLYLTNFSNRENIAKLRHMLSVACKGRRKSCQTNVAIMERLTDFGHIMWINQFWLFNLAKWIWIIIQTSWILMVCMALKSLSFSNIQKATLAIPTGPSLYSPDFIPGSNFHLIMCFQLSYLLGLLLYTSACV